MYVKKLKISKTQVNVSHVNFTDSKYGGQGVVKGTGSMDRTAKRMQATDRKPSENVMR